MKFHCHIPKLLDFALYSACDDIVKHGKQGLPRPMPRPLYYRCIMTFAEKYGKILTIKKIYDDVRRGLSVNMKMKMTLACSISLLDHVVLDGDATGYQTLIPDDAESDVDGFIEYIHRLSARCAAEGRHRLMVMMMYKLFRHNPCRAVREVAILYGAELDNNDENYLYDACRNGIHDIVRDAITSGREFKQHYLRLAIGSGDMETVRLLAHAGGVDRAQAIVKFDQNNHPSVYARDSVSARDFTVNYCQQLLELGIIQRGNHYHLKGFRSIPVTQWLLDHDMLDHNMLVTSVARNAAEYGGLYVDILHYLIETVHLVVPKALFSCTKGDGSYDLGVFDYLLANGANVNEVCDLDYSDDLYGGAPAIFPLHLRYWSDSSTGLQSESEWSQRRLTWNVMKSCIVHELPVCVLDMCRDLLSCDVNIVDVDAGMSLLHCASAMVMDLGDDDEDNDAVRVSMTIFKHLLEHGAFINVKDDNNRTPLHVACIHSVSRVISNLLDRGAAVNARDDDGQTPLMIAIAKFENPCQGVRVLLEYGANVHVPNNKRQTPLHVACERRNSDHSYTIVNMLLQHGAGLNVNAMDDRGRTPFESTTHNNVKELLKRHGYNKK